MKDLRNNSPGANSSFKIGQDMSIINESLVKLSNNNSPNRYLLFFLNSLGVTTKVTTCNKFFKNNN